MRTRKQKTKKLRTTADVIRDVERIAKQLERETLRRGLTRTLLSLGVWAD